VANTDEREQGPDTGQAPAADDSARQDAVGAGSDGVAAADDAGAAAQPATEPTGDGGGDLPPLPPPWIGADAPTEEMSNLEVARIYLARGWIPLPIRSEYEAAEFTEWKVRARKAESPEISDDDLELFRANTYRRSLKSTFVSWSGGRWIASRPTDEQLLDWFEHKPDRGIFLLTGPGTGLTVLDVDTYKGGAPEPWCSLASIVVTTPRGGVQCYFAEAEAPTDNDWPAPGLDRRGAGGGVAAPAGRATPGRAFTRWSPVLVPWPATELDAVAAAQPPDSAVARKRKVPVTPAHPPASSAPLGPPRLRLSSSALTPLSTMARVLAGPVKDGERTAAAKEIVGMLCRAQPVPDDAAAVLLDMLEQHATGAPPAAQRALRAGWAATLASPVTRAEELVVLVVEAWATLRCDPPWQPSAGPVAEVAASLWRTASANENAKAKIAALPPPPPAPAPTPENPDPDDPQLAQWCPRESDRYTHVKYRQRLSLGRLSIAKLPGWTCRDHHDLGHSLSVWGHGLGPWLDKAIGGLRPGRLIVLGARKAKGGKTAFLHQLVDGLAMLSVERLDLAGSSAPLLMVVWLTEMDLDDLPERGIARYLGVSQGHFQGDDPLQTDVDLVDAYFGNPADKYRRSRKFVRLVEVGELLRVLSDGPALLEYVEELVNGARDLLAAETERQVWPVLVVDPYQRRAENTEETTAAETAIAKLLDTVTDKHGWICLVTSDTTKASATDTLDSKLPPDIVCASVMRGSYAMTHVADVTMALDVETGGEHQDERRAAIYVGVTRGAPGADQPIPFRYWRSLGRFVAVDPTPPTPPSPPPSANPPDSDNPPAPAVRHRFKAESDKPKRRRKAGNRGAHLRSRDHA